MRSNSWPKHRHHRRLRDCRSPKIRNALRRARRRNVIEKAGTLKAVLRSKHLAQSDRVAEAYAAVVRSLIAVLETLNDEIAFLANEVETLFGLHPDAAVYLSQPGLGPILGARVLAEFGDDPDRYADASARKNYAGTSPITRAWREKEVRPRQIRAQRSPRGRTRAPGLHNTDRLARCPQLLRRTPSARDQSPCRAETVGKPDGGDPAWMPEVPTRLRRNHCLGTSRKAFSSLTFQGLGCLSSGSSFDARSEVGS